MNVNRVLVSCNLFNRIGLTCTHLKFATNHRSYSISKTTIKNLKTGIYELIKPNLKKVGRANNLKLLNSKLYSNALISNVSDNWWQTKCNFSSVERFQNLKLAFRRDPGNVTLNQIFFVSAKHFCRSNILKKKYPENPQKAEKTKNFILYSVTLILFVATVLGNNYINKGFDVIEIEKK